MAVCFDKCEIPPAIRDLREIDDAGTPDRHFYRSQTVGIALAENKSSFCRLAITVITVTVRRGS
jgi:hypothetical protein